MKIIECVPNISEGKDLKKIEAIAEEVKKTPGAYLLDTYTGISTNRTVFTLAGEPESIKEAVYKIFEKTSRLIDMRTHKGVHPRIGAVDVCPFVPVYDTTMEECVDITRNLGKKIAEELGIPVYLYGKSATGEIRKDLSNIRKGQYEGLKEKMKRPEWKPDFGEAKFNEEMGASVIGARDFLIAFNINLNTKDEDLAEKIAEKIRESGTTKLDGTGKKVKIPGTLKKVKAIGWYIEELECAQVSANLNNFRITSLYRFFQEVQREAKAFGIEVTGSELVGLIPEEAILETGRIVIAERFPGREYSKDEIIDAAIDFLGLARNNNFNPEEKILQKKIKKEIL